MNRSWGVLWAVLAAVAGNVGCSNSRDERADALSAKSRALYARSSVLWPIVNGRATVRVCWLPLELGGETFPVASLAPNEPNILPIRKQWTRDIVEAEWNALTPLDFEGWQDCDGSPADVRIRPMSSAYLATCGGAKGQSCVEALGTGLRDGELALNLNLMFGDEVRYSSRYQQTSSGNQYNQALDLARWWVPEFCLDAFRRPWSTHNSQTTHRVDITDPSVSAEFEATYQTCLQANVLHEFGHVAGFAHEQYRPDDAAKQADCYAYEKSIGITDDQPPPSDSMYAGTEPLGPFDTESIMSYCRRDTSATLTTEDIAMTALAYGVDPPVIESADAGSGGLAAHGGAAAMSGGGAAAMSGGAGGTSSASGGSAPAKESKHTSGCSLAAGASGEHAWQSGWFALCLGLVLRRRRAFTNASLRQLSRANRR